MDVNEALAWLAVVAMVVFLGGLVYVVIVVTTFEGT